MATEYQKAKSIYKLPLDELRAVAPEIRWNNPPTLSADLFPVEVCRSIGDWYMAQRDDEHRHRFGQFFTPPAVARFMARLAGLLQQGERILDPGAGIGILSCALCEAALKENVSSLSIVAYESDPVLHVLCQFALSYTGDFLQVHGIQLHFEVLKYDFIEAMAEQMAHTSLWVKETQAQDSFDLAMLNPPYFKVNQNDPRTRLVKDITHGRTNMYTMFMSLAADKLREGGHFISITPRSFASGAYFQHFRRQFFDAISPEIIHIFESRNATFEDADVLQENIILAGRKKSSKWSNTPSIALSRSQGIADLTDPLIQQLPRKLILDDQQKDPLLRLPTSDIDTHLLEVFRRWNNYLATYGLEISTGPVVPFRAQDVLTGVEEVQQDRAVPLLWLQHIRRMEITWPLKSFDKPQGVSLQDSQKLLVPNTTQIILRRFSAKEEPRRITAAVLPAGTFSTDFIGLENHLNYIYRPKGVLSYEEAIGLAAFLNSSFVDRYFRITSGNTQVNATELRKLPLPLREQILRIGERVIETHNEQNANETEHIIMDVLGRDLVVGSEEEDLQLPVFKDSRILMGKIQEAQRILRDLGLPPPQQNEISALTLLALCHLLENAHWSEVTQEPITIHNMMGFMKANYGRAYAENTREVVRRQVIHQFEQARLVDRNPDDPSRMTNSPNTCYALTNEAHAVLALYSTSKWEETVINFIEQHGALYEKYQRLKASVSLPLKLADGSQIYLTPGKHNQLQIAVIELFGPRFVPNATVLYLGDAAKKHVIYEQEKLQQLGVPITQHDKLPDVILHDEARNRLYLIEAVTSHGPVTPKRLFEMEKFLEYCPAKRVYISAFPTYTRYRHHQREIAWDTEIWISEEPKHMFHHDGDKYVSLHG